MKTIAIILFVLQGMSLLGAAAGNGLDSVIGFGNMYEISKTFGYFLPTIIGVILMNKAKS